MAMMWLMVHRSQWHELSLLGLPSRLRPTQTGFSKIHPDNQRFTNETTLLIAQCVGNLLKLCPKQRFSRYCITSLMMAGTAWSYGYQVAWSILGFETEFSVVPCCTSLALPILLYPRTGANTAPCHSRPHCSRPTPTRYPSSVLDPQRQWVCSVVHQSDMTYWSRPRCCGVAVRTDKA